MNILITKTVKVTSEIKSAEFLRYIYVMVISGHSSITMWVT